MKPSGQISLCETCRFAVIRFSHQNNSFYSFLLLSYQLWNMDDVFEYIVLRNRQYSFAKYVIFTAHAQLVVQLPYRLWMRLICIYWAVIYQDTFYQYCCHCLRVREKGTIASHCIFIAVIFSFVSKLLLCLFIYLFVRLILIYCLMRVLIFYEYRLSACLLVWWYTVSRLSNILHFLFGGMCSLIMQCQSMAIKRGNAACVVDNVPTVSWDRMYFTLLTLCRLSAAWDGVHFTLLTLCQLLAGILVYSVIHSAVFFWLELL